MSLIEEKQVRREITQFHRLGMDAHRVAQYTTMASLFEQAVNLATRLEDTPLLLKERFWLAEALRMQSKYTQAIAVYTWMIGLANDPEQSRAVSDESSLWYLTGGFIHLTSCGRFLPEIPVDYLQRVVTDGLAWLKGVGMEHWSASLHFEQGMLLKRLGKMEQARQELERALSLKRRYRDTPGYTLAMYQLHLADLLRMEPIRSYTTSVELAMEVLDASTSNTYDRWWAYLTLAYSRLGLDEDEAAYSAASECLMLAHSIESPQVFVRSYTLMGRVQREVEQMDEAMAAVVQEWYWARRAGTVEHINYSIGNCARVRILQAREAAGLRPDWNSLPEQLPDDSDRAQAKKYLQKAQRFISWAYAWATKMDEASGRYLYRDELDVLTREADTLAALLAKTEQ